MYRSPIKLPVTSGSGTGSLMYDRREASVLETGRKTVVGGLSQFVSLLLLLLSLKLTVFLSENVRRRRCEAWSV